MRFDQRVVTQIPLQELWTDRGEIQATRGRQLGRGDVATFLHREPLLSGTTFAVADVGSALRWLDPPALLAFWKEEARGRIVEASASGFRLEDYPGGFCFIVTEWHRADSQHPILLFERHH
jgi:hypothetical protein